MTDPRAPETANPSQAARLLLALLLTLLLAILPGPQVTAAASQSQQLSASAPTLTAIHGRDLIARNDGLHIRPLATTALPPPEPVTSPPRIALRLAFTYRAQTGISVGALTPCARGPPHLPLTA